MEQSKKITDLEMELCNNLLETSKKIHSLKSKYDSYRDDVAKEKKEADRKQIIERLRDDLSYFLENDIKKMKDTLTKSINTKKKPLISSGNGAGAVEYNSALLFVNNLPDGWKNILDSAFTDKRYDFVFSVLELMSENKQINNLHRHSIEQFNRKFETALGIEQDLYDIEGINAIEKKSNKLTSYEMNNEILFDNLKIDDLNIIKTLDSDFYEVIRSEKFPESKTDPVLECEIFTKNETM